MQTKGPEKNSTLDWLESVHDLTNRRRYLHKLKNDLDACEEAGDSAETQALRIEFAEVFADMLGREHFLEVCKQNGENIPATLSRPSRTA
jgi:hypothetical protein